MPHLDADGMKRVNLEWRIEGKKGTQAGTLYNLHSAEVIHAKQVINRRARRGDTIITREI